MFGIQHPIILAGANYVSVPGLVAAVSNAGGLGIMASGRFADFKEDIRAVRSQTCKPFGVNIVLGAPGYEKRAEIALEERVPMIAHARGNPKWLMEATRGSGTVVMPVVGTLRHAVRAEEDGASAVMVQGLEGGGHTSHVASMVLLPLIASSVKIPVVAAGGFCDGKGLIAALALGAEGMAMGTRFALTQESGLSSDLRPRYLRSSEADTIVTARITGTRLRVIQNKLTDFLEGEGRKLSARERISSVLETRKMLGVSWWRFLLGGLRMTRAHEASLSDLGSLATGGLRIRRALADGDEESGAMPCGQVCGRINDIPTAQELVERIVAEASTVLESLNEKMLSDDRD